MNEEIKKLSKQVYDIENELYNKVENLDNYMNECECDFDVEDEE